MTVVLGSTYAVQQFHSLTTEIRPKVNLGSQTDNLKPFGTGVSSNIAPRACPNDANSAASPHCRRGDDSKMVSFCDMRKSKMFSELTVVVVLHV